MGGDKWGVTVGIRKVGSGYRECPTAPNSHVAQPLALPTSSDSPTARQCPTVPDSADSDPSRDHSDSARQCSTVLDSCTRQLHDFSASYRLVWVVSFGDYMNDFPAVRGVFSVCAVQLSITLAAFTSRVDMVVLLMRVCAGSVAEAVILTCPRCCGASRLSRRLHQPPPC